MTYARKRVTALGADRIMGSFPVPESLMTETCIGVWTAYGTGVTDGQAIPGWTSSYGSLSLESSGNARPTYHASGGSNDKPYVEFDGSNDTLSAIITFPTSYTIGALAYGTGVAKWNPIWTIDASGSRASVSTRADSINSARVHDQSNASVVVGPTWGAEWKPVVMSHASGTYNLRVSKSGYGPGTGSNENGSRTFYVGSHTSYYATLRLSYLVIFSGALTSTQMDDLADYMTSVYG